MTNPTKNLRTRGDATADTLSGVPLHLLMHLVPPVVLVEADGDDGEQDGEAGAADLADRALTAAVDALVAPYCG